MGETSRRDVLRTLLLAGAATAAVGLAVMPEPAEAIAVMRRGYYRPYFRPYYRRRVRRYYRRRRRWACWWNANLGRSVCGWRGRYY
jgi:hypothetical protein